MFSQDLVGATPPKIKLECGSAARMNRSLAPAFQAPVGVDHWKSKHILATMRAFLCLALLVVVCEAVFQPQMTDFRAKRCELKLFGIPYFKGINDVVTDDVKVRKTYVDDKSLYTSGNTFAITRAKRNTVDCRFNSRTLKIVSSEGSLLKEIGR